MQENNLELKPIIEADPVLFSPDTLGWKIVFGIATIVLLYALYKLYIKYRENAYRRKAISDISNLYQSENQTTNDIIVEVMFLLKNVALTTYGRNAVASLKSAEWLKFLDQKNKTSYFQKNEAEIVNALYKNQTIETANFNKELFLRMSKSWIRKHA